MGISGCTSCQVGGAEALKAYGNTFQNRRENAALESSKAELTQHQNYNQPGSDNRPVANSTVGSIINVSV